MFNELREITAQIIQPSREQLREFAKEAGDERVTEYGSVSYVSEVRSRSAKFTTVTSDDGMSDADYKLLEEVKEHLAGRELIQIDRVICFTSERITMRVIIPKEFARIPHGWSMLLKDEGTVAKPDIVTIDIPDWPERRVIVDPESKTNILCGTDYIGEMKMSGLRLAMYHMKQRGGLGLHAGSKKFRARNTATGEIEEHGCIFFGLSGTGKSTLVCHHCGIEGEGEGQTILQDDIVLLGADGSAVGTEDNFYVKTIGVTAEGQPLIHKALTSPDAVLENVMVSEDGKVDLHNDKITANGRAVVSRSQMAHTKPEEIDLELVDHIFFITRNGLMPPIARLSSLQAARYFMLGETVETGAGDPDEIGKAKRVVGFSPFIIGSPGEEGNRFYDIIKGLSGVQAFVINTGAISGSKGAHDISLQETTELIRRLMRNELQWITDEETGLEVPTDVALHRELYDEGEFIAKWRSMEDDRREHLAKYPDLYEEISQA